MICVTKSYRLSAVNELGFPWISSRYMLFVVNVLYIYRRKQRQQNYRLNILVIKLTYKHVPQLNILQLKKSYCTILTEVVVS